MTKIKIEWDKAEGGKFLKEAGEYIVKLKSYEVDENDEGTQYVRWAVEVVKGPQTGAGAKIITSLGYKSLWKFEDFLNAVCYPVKRGSVQDLDLDDVLKKAKDFAVEFVEGREREDGKGYYLQAEDFMPLDDYEEATKSVEEEKERPENDFDRLDRMIEEHDLDIDLEDYDTYEEAEAAIKKAIKKAESKKESTEKKTYTTEMIESLRSAELDKLAEEYGLEFDEDASPRSKRRSLIKMLSKEGLLVDGE